MYRSDPTVGPTLGNAGLAHVAQMVERVLGKDEVTSSILVVGSLGVGKRPAVTGSSKVNVPKRSGRQARRKDWAGVTQWLESRPSKPLVAGSNPVSRSS